MPSEGVTGAYAGVGRSVDGGCSAQALGQSSLRLGELLQLLLGVFLSFFFLSYFWKVQGVPSGTGWHGLLARRRCAERLSGGRVPAGRPGQLGRQAGEAAGLGLAGKLLESVRCSRACSRLLAIGGAVPSRRGRWYA